MGQGQRASGRGARLTEVRQPVLVYATRHREDGDAPDIITMAEKLVRRECEAYLAYISVADSKNSLIKNIQTVRDFPDVFPEELPGLPLNLFAEGIQVDPRKIEAMLNWKQLKSVSKICSFLELESFAKLEKILTQAPVLIQPEPGRDFVVYSDVSHMGLGCFLIQDGKIRPTLLGQIKDKQLGDESLQLICVPNDEDLRLSILKEVHSSPYAMHSGGNKMYKDLQELYWWPRLKREVTDYIALCLTCQQLGERRVLGLNLVSETKDKVRLIRERLKAASGRQKSYADLKKKDIEYSVGDMVFLRVLPWKKVLRFGRKGKLSPRFIGPYRILKRVGPVAYQLELPSELDRIHDVYVSMLRRYHSNPRLIVLVEEIEMRLDLTFEEEPIQILDRDVKVLHRKSIPLVNVLCWNHSTEEVTWESEDSMRQ
ncbi:uncharacterized protein [Gossypium hirsutum]|uniref:DNA/RNA polymerases superfamily protein n=1 Tax=Gossypium hirsutum TaxID=3635 RepID=A0A1U8IAY9_GOSHI|nr:uncharacterized protein LOC107894642 [Gossypium hirsutum]